jgi:hypothetical protein
VKNSFLIVILSGVLLSSLIQASHAAPNKFLGTSSASTPTKFRAQSTDISITYYAVIDNEARLLADSQVTVVPCAPINADCKDLQDKIQKVFGTSKALSSKEFEHIQTEIEDIVRDHLQVQVYRTNLKGVVKFSCPALNCLTYHSKQIGKENIFWVSLFRANSENEMPSSLGKSLPTKVMPLGAIHLAESLETMSGSFTAGVSYSSLSSTTATFYSALQSFSSSEEYKQSSEYESFVARAKRISTLLHVLSTIWEAKIAAPTQPYNGKDVKVVPEGLGASIIDLYNSAIDIGEGNGYQINKDTWKGCNWLIGCKYNVDGLFDIAFESTTNNIASALQAYGEIAKQY